MSLLTHNSAKPIALQSGGVPPPTPYTGPWHPNRFITIMSGGKLYLSLYDVPLNTGRTFVSTNYGNTWTLFAEDADIGGPGTFGFRVTPTSAGFVLLGRDGWFWHSPSGLPGTWVQKADKASSGGDLWCKDGTSPYVWGSARFHYGGLNSKQCRLSSDGGLTWGWARETPAVIAQNMAQVRVNSSLSDGLIADSYRKRLAYGSDPTLLDQTWAERANTSYAHAFGVQWNRVALPHTGPPFAPGCEEFSFSTDKAATYTHKALPAGLTGDIEYARIVMDIDPNNTDRVICIAEGDTPGMYISEDWGDSWTWLNNIHGPRDGSSEPGIRYDPYKAGVCYSWSKYGFFRSEDNGYTWWARSLGLY